VFASVAAVAFLFPHEARHAESWRHCMGLGLNRMAIGATFAAAPPPPGPEPSPASDGKASWTGFSWCCCDCDNCSGACECVEWCCNSCHCGSCGCG
jgi:hypothetical protein